MNRIAPALVRTALVLLAATAVPPSVARAESVPAPAAAAAPTPLAMAKQRLYAATYAPTESLVAARGALAALSAAAPKSAIRHYWVALADYRLTPRFMGAKGAGGSGDSKQAGRWCEDGLGHLEQALKLDPKLADALALQAGLMGMAISIDPSRAMALGGQIQETLGRAEALAPRNPRIALIRGINVFHMPPFFGGGAERALGVLQKAQELYASEKPAPEAIDWGHDEAFAWAGRAAGELGRIDDARAFYQKALAINPGNYWVETSLLPELERKAKS